MGEVSVDRNIVHSGATEIMYGKARGTPIKCWVKGDEKNRKNI
jgi:hypothetical protein